MPADDASVPIGLHNNDDDDDDDLPPRVIMVVVMARFIESMETLIVLVLSLGQPQTNEENALLFFPPTNTGCVCEKRCRGQRWFTCTTETSSVTNTSHSFGSTNPITQDKNHHHWISAGPCHCGASSHRYGRVFRHRYSPLNPLLYPHCHKAVVSQAKR